MNEIPSLGQVAFEAYRAEVGGLTFDGKPIPGWDELHGDRLKVQGGWEAAAQAIRQHTQMIAALDAAKGATVKDFRESQASRWQPVDNPAPAAPIGEFIPAGHGEPPTGKHVAVEAGPDSDRD